MSQATLLEGESRDFARSSISHLDFNLDSNLVSKVNEAQKKFVLLRSDMPFQQVICDDFDYALIKKRKLSPDFIVKLTAQVIYNRCFNCLLTIIINVSLACFLYNAHAFSSCY